MPSSATQRRLDGGSLFDLEPGLYVTNHMLEGYDSYEQLGTCTNRCFFCCDEFKSFTGTDTASFIKRNPGDNDKIFLCGCEPTGLDQLFDTLRFLKTRYRVVAVATNGIRLGRPAFARQLADAGIDELLFSLHGHEARLHDRVTQVDGSFERSVAGIRTALRLRRDGAATWQVGLNSVLTRSNIEHLQPFLRFVQELGIELVCFSTLLPLGLGEQAFAEEILSYRRTFDALGRAHQRVATHGHPARLRVFLLHVPFCATPPALAAPVTWLLTRCPGEFRSLVSAASRSRCAGCSFDSYCEGVFDAYAAEFGFDEFRLESGSSRPALESVTPGPPDPPPGVPVDQRARIRQEITTDSQAVFCTSVDGRLGEIPDDFSHLSYFRLDPALQYRFLFYYDTNELLQYSRLLTDRSILIRCGDIECINAIIPLFYFFYGFMPQLDSKRNLHPLSSQLQAKMQFEHLDGAGDELLKPLLAVSTALEVTDGHVVFGPEDMIEGALDQLLRRDFTPCIFSHSCINKVIGTDVEGVIARSAERHRTKIVHDCNIGIEQFHADVARIYDEQFRGRAAAHVKTPRSVNLIGFEQDRSLGELAHSLELLGLRISEICVPDVSREAMANLACAELQVLNAIDGYEPIYDRLFRRLGIDCIMPPAPYGMESTDLWLKETAGHFDIDPDQVPPWTAYRAAREARRKALHDHASRLRIGMVLAPADIEALRRPSCFFHSIPVIPLLEEMGFTLDFLVTRSTDPARSQSRLAELLREPRRHTTKFASSVRDLRSWLRNEPCRCVYSDLKTDQRIIEHGKASFSLFIFERGFDGFLRSQERLINLCGTSFYHEYRDYRKAPAHPVTA